MELFFVSETVRNYKEKKYTPAVNVWIKDHRILGYLFNINLIKRLPQPYFMQIKNKSVSLKLRLQ